MIRNSPDDDTYISVHNKSRKVDGKCSALCCVRLGGATQRCVGANLELMKLVGVFQMHLIYPFPMINRKTINLGNSA